MENEKARPLLIAADVYRPAAIDQLQTIGKQLNVPVFEMGTDTIPLKLCVKGWRLPKKTKTIMS